MLLRIAKKIYKLFQIISGFTSDEIVIISHLRMLRQLSICLQNYIF